MPLHIFLGLKTTFACLPTELQCPFCSRIIVPLRGTTGKLLCPLCQNRGTQARPAHDHPVAQGRTTNLTTASPYSSVLAEVYKLSPRGFERLVQEVFTALGYRCRLTPASGDFGADVVAEKRGLTTIVEAKKHKHPVGPAVIQRALGALHHHKADRAVVVALGGFTRAAHRAAQDVPIILWDAEDLLETLPGHLIERFNRFETPVKARLPSTAPPIGPLPPNEATAAYRSVTAYGRKCQALVQQLLLHQSPTLDNSRDDVAEWIHSVNQITFPLEAHLGDFPGNEYFSITRTANHQQIAHAYFEFIQSWTNESIRLVLLAFPPDVDEVRRGLIHGYSTVLAQISQYFETVVNLLAGGATTIELNETILFAVSENTNERTTALLRKYNLGT